MKNSTLRTGNEEFVVAAAGGAGVGVVGGGGSGVARQTQYFVVIAEKNSLVTKGLCD